MSERRYLDLLKACVTGLIYGDPSVPYPWAADSAPGDDVLAFDRDRRIAGEDWPRDAHTMVGMLRLDNVEDLIRRILEQQIPGDLAEAGVGRGGAVLFMRGMLAAERVTDRTIWALDSFEGLPRPGHRGLTDRSYASAQFVEARSRERRAQLGAAMAAISRGTSLAEVQATFSRYRLLDDRVRFVKGWFCDTLPSAPIGQLALLRIDVDLFDSTLEVLRWGYPKVSPGGFVIIDDYHSFSECREALDLFLAAQTDGIELVPVDRHAVYFRKPLIGEEA